MNMDVLKGILSSVYLGPAWKKKVACMDEGQAVAVYNSFLARGLIGKQVTYEPPKGTDGMKEITEELPLDRIMESYGRNAEQITIDELFERNKKETK